MQKIREFIPVFISRLGRGEMSHQAQFASRWPAPELPSYRTGDFSPA